MFLLYQGDGLKPGINALVVGAGRFGKHYAKILSRLNNENRPGIPYIDRLIITKTRLHRARDFADSLQEAGDCSVNEVIPAEAGHPDQLTDLLLKYKPQFTGIVALDKDIGDTIHAVYTAQALRYGAVLCEKPFGNAVGDGSSLAYFDDLPGYDNAALFGLELPMAVVMRDMMQSRELGSLLTKARHFEFRWETTVSSGGDIINDLALHPWSFIPEHYTIRSADVDDRTASADVTLHLYNEISGLDATCKMVLRAGGTFRGMSIDGHAVVFRSEGTTLKLMETNTPLEAAAKSGGPGCSGPALLMVDNPLKQNILAVLRKNPLVKLKRAYASQLFLEMLQGYTPNAGGHMI